MADSCQGNAREGGEGIDRRREWVREMQAMGSQFMKRQSREQTEVDLMLSVVLCSFSLVLFVVRSRTIAGMNRRRGIQRERDGERWRDAECEVGET